MKRYLILLIFISNFCLAQTEKQPEYEKNDLRLNLKLPHINHLSLKPNENFRDDQFGFNGYGLGIEYSYKENRFLETSFSFVLTFELPFPASVDKEYNKSLYSYFISTTDNIIHKRFTFGYGINYSVNYWSEWYRDLGTVNLPIIEKTTYENRSLGVTLNSYYRIGKTLNVGFIYRPSLFNLDNGFDLTYEHLISLELNWRIKLFNLRK